MVSRAGTHMSKLEKESGPVARAVTHPPSFFVLVVGSREECDPKILELCEEGFLKLRFDPSHKHAAYHPEAGTFVPSNEEVDSFEEDGQINPGTGYRDGEEYVITSGRGRLKRCAIINQRRSNAAGKFKEDLLYKFTVMPKGTTERDIFVQMVGENFDRRDEKPSTIAFLIREAKTRHKMTAEERVRRFHLTPAMQDHYIALLDCAEPVRALVDDGKLALRTAAECLSKIARDKQVPAIEECATRGVTRGDALYVCLKRLSQGLPMFGDDGDMPAPPPSDDDSPSAATPADSTSPDVSAAPAATTPGKRAKKSAEPKPAAATPPKHIHVRPPTKQRLALWIDALKPHTAAEPPRMPKGVPAEIKKAVEEAYDAAFFEGARIMALRMQGKTPSGWGKLRDVLEASESADA